MISISVKIFFFAPGRDWPSLSKFPHIYPEARHALPRPKKKMMPKSILVEHCQLTGEQEGDLVNQSMTLFPADVSIPAEKTK